MLVNPETIQLSIFLIFYALALAILAHFFSKPHKTHPVSFFGKVLKVVEKFTLKAESSRNFIGVNCFE